MKSRGTVLEENPAFLQEESLQGGPALHDNKSKPFNPVFQVWKTYPASLSLTAYPAPQTPAEQAPDALPYAHSLPALRSNLMPVIDHYD